MTLCACQNEEPLVLDEGQIINELHAKSIGNLVFMGDFIPYEDFSEKDFVKELTITVGGNFHVRMFLEKTLTYYLHELEPELPVRELCDKGNFQLTFLVDNQEIYKYNLQTGAGSCEYKNSATVYGIPLSDSAESDHWGRFLWTRFLKQEGGEEALSNGSHLLTIEVRPYIQSTQLKVGAIIAQGKVDLSIVEEDVSSELTAIQQIEPTDKWTLSDAAYDTVLIQALNKKIAQNYFKSITSIVVLKDGKLLIEEYFNGADRASLHDTRSVGKTLASTLMGMAIGDQYILDERRTLSDFYKVDAYDHYSVEKGNVSLKSLLTMSSGIKGSDIDPDSPGNEENMYPTKDWVKFALDLPMDPEKQSGQDWEYFSAGAVLLGDILNKTVPSGLETYAEEKLFQPLGITDYTWQFTPTHVPNTAGGFQMNSLDNARYIQLYMNDGVYQGKQIVPKSWVDASMTKHVSIPDRENEFYGYLLWNKSFMVEDKPIEAFYASGNGGNKLMICKDLGIVIVLTSTAYGQPYMHIQAEEIIQDYVLP
ncbi:MAG: beta-lactamase family protein, partial [Bacteroidia bacterium]|nr:beta-lactamase family protein [Bacteroidia bacterium]